MKQRNFHHFLGVSDDNTAVYFELTADADDCDTHEMLYVAVYEMMQAVARVTQPENLTTDEAMANLEKEIGKMRDERKIDSLGET